MTLEEIKNVLSECYMELMDGIGIAGYRRQFTNDEYDCMRAVINYVSDSIDKAYTKKVDK